MENKWILSDLKMEETRFEDGRGRIDMEMEEGGVYRIEDGRGRIDLKVEEGRVQI